MAGRPRDLELKKNRYGLKKKIKKSEQSHGNGVHQSTFHRDQKTATSPGKKTNGDISDGNAPPHRHAIWTLVPRSTGAKRAVGRVQGGEETKGVTGRKGVKKGGGGKRPRLRGTGSGQGEGKSGGVTNKEAEWEEKGRQEPCNCKA